MKVAGEIVPWKAIGMGWEGWMIVTAVRLRRLLNSVHKNFRSGKFWKVWASCLSSSNSCLWRVMELFMVSCSLDSDMLACNSRLNGEDRIMWNYKFVSGQ